MKGSADTADTVPTEGAKDRGFMEPVASGTAPPGDYDDDGPDRDIFWLSDAKDGTVVGSYNTPAPPPVVRLPGGKYRAQRPVRVGRTFRKWELREADFNSLSRAYEYAWGDDFWGSRPGDTARRHHLKLDFKWFCDVEDGKKFIELRKNDRDYELGDELVLHEVQKSERRCFPNGWCSGKWMTARVGYIMENAEGLEDGYVILFLTDVHRKKRRDI